MLPCSCGNEDIEVQEAVDHQVQRARLQFKGAVRRKHNFMSPPPIIKPAEHRPIGVFSFKAVTAERAQHQSTASLVTITQGRPIQSSQANPVRSRQPKVSLSQSFSFPHPPPITPAVQPNTITTQTNSNQNKISFKCQSQPVSSHWMKNAVSPKTQDSLRKSQTTVNLHFQNSVGPVRPQPQIHSRLAMKKPTSLNIEANPPVINNFLSPKESKDKRLPLEHNTDLFIGNRPSHAFSVTNLYAPHSRTNLRKDSARSQKSIIDALQDEQLASSRHPKMKSNLAVVQELPSPCDSDFNGWPSPSYEVFLSRKEEGKSGSHQHSPQPPTIAESDEFSLFDNVRLANSQAFQ